MAVAKVTINNNVILDLTDATAGASTIVSPYTAYISDGSKAVGQASGGGGTPTLQTKTKNYTPTETAQSEAVTYDSGYDGLDTVNVSVGAISSTYVGSGITRRISSDLSANGATVTAPAGYYENAATKSVATTTHPDPTVSIDANGLITASHTQTAGYVSAGTTTATQQLTKRTSSDMSASGATVTAPAGYYPSTSSKSVATTTHPNPSVSVDANGLITATHTQGSGYVTGGTTTATSQMTVLSASDITGTITTTLPPAAEVTVPAGYVGSAITAEPFSEMTTSTASTVTINSSGDVAVAFSPATSGIGFSTRAYLLQKTGAVTTQAGSTITPTESQQVAVPASTYTTGAVNVGAISSSYVGSGVTRRSSSDLTLSSGTFTAPAGYYDQNATMAVTTVTHPAPTVSIDSNGLITASHTQTAGLVEGGTTTATDQLALLSAASITGTISTGLNAKAEVTVQPGYAASAITKEPFSEMTTSTAATASIDSSGDLTATFRPATSGIGFAQHNYTITKSGFVTTQGATTITPSTTQQTAVASGVYTTGAVTVAPIPSQYIIPSGSQTITTNNTYDVTALAEVVVNVAGSSGLTYETGTYTPTSDTARPTISFSNSHTNPPILVALSDTSAASGITSNSNILFVFWDPYQQNGAGYPYSTSATRYSVAYYSYRSSNGTSSAATLIQYNSSNTGDSSTSYSRYWASASNFHPYSNSTSRYFRANRNYKWIAVWKA